MDQEIRLKKLLDAFKRDSADYKDLVVEDNIDDERRALRSLMNIRMPGELSEDVIELQDEYLQERAREKGIVTLEDIPTIKELYGSSAAHADVISVWQGDITRLKAGAIVNAANSQMLGCFVPMHTCIDNCIHTFAGIQLRNDCNRYMARMRAIKGAGYEEPTGQAFVTKGYNLPAEYVIQTVGPIVQYEVTKELEQDLKNCYKNCLDAAYEKGIRSIAFCCISTGVFHYPNDMAAKVAVDTVNEWIDAQPDAMDRVIFNVFKDVDLELYERVLKCRTCIV